MASMNSNEISAWIRERIAKDLGSEASAIDPEVTFDRIGLDSLALLGVLGDLAKLLAAGSRPLGAISILNRSAGLKSDAWWDRRRVVDGGAAAGSGS